MNIQLTRVQLGRIGQLVLNTEGGEGVLLTPAPIGVVAAVLNSDGDNIATFLVVGGGEAILAP
jgi:hypothetical protein